MTNTWYASDWDQAYRPVFVRHMQKSVVQWSVISKFTGIIIIIVIIIILILIIIIIIIIIFKV